MKRPGCTMLVTRSARTSVSQRRSIAQAFRREIGADAGEHQSDATMVTARNGRNSRHGDMPAAFMTMISESVRELVAATWATAITSAIGAMTRTSMRNDQAGDADEDQDGLALVGHQVDVAQRLRDPDAPRSG